MNYRILGRIGIKVSEIDIAAVNKYLDLALVQDVVPETLKDHHALLNHHAGECIECGECMKNCPSGVPIIEKMKQVVAVFGK